ncbi:MAG: CBS domain-containing protein [Methanocorpusculum sp.]|uniref:CBS domain-containing protein n=1 Tax=Methanocorpusculum petauri TaxID=3002863 RepID=A0ABT4IHU6_9EURY|nr:CBS domain-containing protein [Methanocorpusculum petauri]MDE2443475.1 CBS domain-containing protein [Methanocorpusculum sp.]MCZ0860658.1 CBS domain-containing protein [Methanocorpusculum petauri]MDE2519272.1 CBS domain-containing protein [Methanocorpusculum sp.]MDE2522660.1 CBS domain-containing protein [Methanocorpusculum sp.]MDE2524351.1 CBS domain-containing protein [Methanocorpusculum sp.]
MTNIPKQQKGNPRIPGAEGKTKSAGKKSSLLGIATTNVISVPPTMNIIEGVQMMSRHNFRRLPITDPGNKKLIGIVTITDVINMMGGGSRYNLVANRHKGSLLSALNDEIRAIATEKVDSLAPSTSIQEAICLLVKSGHGSFPITNPDNTIAGIVTEYDIMKMLAGTGSELIVDEIMTKNPKVVSPDAAINSVTKQMVDHDYRRLPVVADDLLIGMITATDIMGYLGRGRVFTEMKTGSVDEVLNLPVRDLMTGANIRTISPDEKINDVARDMLEFGIGAFPVIDEGKLTGIVTEFDLVKGLAGNM